MKITLFIAAGILGIVSACAGAEEPPPPPPGNRPPPTMMSPARAAALCRGKTIGTAVQWTAPDGRLVNGQCQLGFVPDHPLPPDE